MPDPVAVVPDPVAVVPDCAAAIPVQAVRTPAATNDIKALDFAVRWNALMFEPPKFVDPELL